MKPYQNHFYIPNNLTIYFFSKPDFDLASFENQQLWGGTKLFASSNWFATPRRNRHQIDDLESLIFSIWHVAGVPGDGVPEGLVLSECKVNGTAEAKMKVIATQLKVKYLKRRRFEIFEFFRKDVSILKTTMYEKYLSL